MFESKRFYTHFLIDGQLYTLKPPYAGYEERRVALLITTGVRPERPQAPGSANIPGHVWNLLVRCWAEDPEERPQIDEVANTLSNLLSLPSTLPLPRLLQESYSKSIFVPDVSLKPSELSEASIWGTAISPNLKLVAFGLSSGHIYIWDMEDGDWQILSGDKGGIYNLSFSQDSKRMVSGSTDKTIRIRDIANRESYILEGHLDWVWAVSFSPDGSMLASGSDDKTVKVWDLALRTSRTYHHSNWVWSVAFSLDGNCLASGAYDVVHVWDLQNDSSTKLSTDYIFSLCWSPDGSYVAIGHYAAISLYNVKDGTHRTIQTPDSIVSISFSPNGNFIATGSDNKVVSLWDATNSAEIQSPVHIFNGHSGPVYSVVFSQDSRYIISACKQGQVRAWGIRYGIIAYSLLPFIYIPNSPQLECVWGLPI